MFGLIITLIVLVGIIYQLNKVNKAAVKRKAEAAAMAQFYEEERQKRVREAAASMRGMMMRPDEIAQAARAEVRAEEQARQENRQRYTDSLKNQNRP